MDTIYKRSSSNVKLCGMEQSLNLEDDKVDDYEQQFAQHEELERQRRALKNRHLDPLYMESDLPEAPDTGAVSLDPNDMTFDF